MPDRTRPERVAVEPPLDATEVAFLRSFHRGPQAVRRVWPGQPSHRSPWSPTEDGAWLVLDEHPDEDEAVTAAGWLRFLARELLAPQGDSSLVIALDSGLSGGHRLTGSVTLEGQRRITVSNNRVSEKVLSGRADADVLAFEGRRSGTYRTDS